MRVLMRKNVLLFFSLKSPGHTLSVKSVQWFLFISIFLLDSFVSCPSALWIISLGGLRGSVENTGLCSNGEWENFLRFLLNSLVTYVFGLVNHLTNLSEKEWEVEWFSSNVFQHWFYGPYLIAMFMLHAGNSRFILRILWCLEVVPCFIGALTILLGLSLWKNLLIHWQITWKYKCL